MAKKIAKTPVSTLRGKLRNVVGTLEILTVQLEEIMELSEPHCEWAGKPIHDRGTPTPYDHIFDHACDLSRKLQGLRIEMRRWLNPRDTFRRRPKAR